MGKFNAKRRNSLAGLLAVLGLFASTQSHAVGALAGTDILNNAQVTYTVGATTATANSNTVTVRVAEILDVVTTLQSGTVSVAPGATSQVLVFRVTNTGNGPQKFKLTLNSALPGDEFDPVPATPAIYFDTDGNGVLSAADTPYVAGSNEPLLAPDGFVTVLVVNNIPTGLTTGNRGLSQLKADCRIGTGTPGTVFAGQGAGGTDAVVGTTGASSFKNGQYIVADVTVVANKTVTVLDPFGGTRPIPGARLTYQIVVTASGTGTATASAVIDLIPPNTQYVAGSLRLNGAALTDAADADAGSFIASPSAQIRVTLGNLTQASGPQTVQFAVTIN